MTPRLMMWGEIDPPVKTQPSLCETEDERKIEEIILPRRCDSSSSEDTQRVVQDIQVKQSATTAVVCFFSFQPQCQVRSAIMTPR